MKLFCYDRLETTKGLECEITSYESEADMFYTQLTPVNVDRPVFCPCTSVEHVHAPLVIYLDVLWKRNEGKKITSTAEHTLSLMLQLAKKARIQLYGKTLGVIGHGRIGSMVANYARALGMSLIVYDSSYMGDTLDFLLRESDVITIHIPLEGNVGFFDASKLRLCKPNALLINTSRPGIVTQIYPTMYYADDFDTPWADITTPHVAGNSREARLLTDEYIVKKINEYRRFYAD